MSHPISLTANDRIHPGLNQALAAVSVHSDGTHAEVGGRTLTGSTPRDLRGLLANAIYEEFHAGNRVARQNNANTAPRRDPRDPRVERRFAGGVPHTTTRVRGKLVAVSGVERGEAGQIVVQLPEITTRMPAERLVAPANPQPGDLVDVDVEAARPALSPGFFYVMGSRPLPEWRGPVRRVFLHALHIESALALWSAVLPALETVAAQYHAKVVSAADDLPRRDGVVIYLYGEQATAEAVIVQAVADIDKGSETSLFVDRLAPGVGAAWDPLDPRPGHGGLSFGQHRSLALATALVDHAVSPSGSLQEHAAMAARAAGIDPLRPANNLTPRQTETRR